MASNGSFASLRAGLDPLELIAARTKINPNVTAVLDENRVGLKKPETRNQDNMIKTEST